MIRRFSMAALALLIAVPLAAQAPAGLQLRTEGSTNAADPDDVPDVTIATVGSGFQINTGPAVIAWDESHTASRPYTLSGTFTLLEPSGHVNYYGLIYGGGSLDEAGQNYMYFVIAQNGSYVVKHRAGGNVHDIQGRTPHDAITKPGDDGTSVNRLEVRVGNDETEFVVNGTVVHTVENSGMAGRTDGVWGVRVNHVIPGVLVEDLGVSR